MKLSKKFVEDLHKIGEDAFIEKNQWIGKLVPDIIIDNLKKRGISQEDVDDCVVLTIEEAKALLFMSGIFSIDHYTPDRNKELLNNLYRQLLRQDFESTKNYFECFRKNEHFRNEWKRIEQAENK